MQLHKKLIPSTLMLLIFISVSASFAGSVGIYSLSWSFPIIDPSYQISLHALDAVGQVVYFGSGKTFGPYNFLYAVNITNGQMIWNYSTVQPVNFVSHFTYNSSDRIIVGTGGSSFISSQSYVLAFRGSQNNATLWNSTNLKSSVLSLGSVNSSDPTTQDVVAGLANGTVVCLSGSNGTVEWRYNAAVPVSPLLYNIFQLNNGSAIVGNRDSGPPNEGHIYCFEKNGILRWSNTSASDNPFTLAREIADVNSDGVPDVVAVFSDGYIYVLDGVTGKSIAPWPFYVGHLVTDLLCTQDYTRDGFPDIIAGINNGTLIIVNGKNASLFKGPTPVSSFTLPHIQYMYFYQNGETYSNKTLVVSAEDSGPAYFIRGVNASTLLVMKEYSVPSVALNLFNIGKSTSNFTGDLLFTTGNTVYCLQGTDIIIPEFESNFVLISLMISIWLLILILRKRS